MDFVFRGFYEQTSSGSRSSNYTYYTQKANQCDVVESYSGGGYDHFIRNRDVRQLEKERMRREILAEKERMRREILAEKERIRREILAEEAMERRRELEAEVRREIREEREIELRRRGGYQWEASRRNCYVERRSFEKRTALPAHERMHDFPLLEEGRTRGYEDEEEEEMPFQQAKRGYEKEELPFQRASQERNMYDFLRLKEKRIGAYGKEVLPLQQASLIKREVKIHSDVFKVGEKKQIISLRVALRVQERTYNCPGLEEGEIGAYDKEALPSRRASKSTETEVKTPPDVLKEEKQITFLAKPSDNLSNKKRKDMASPVQGPSKVTKKLAEEWSCVLCEISATSEQALEDHLKGRKHKSNLARQKAGYKAGMIGLGSENINNLLNPSQVGEKNAESEKSQQIAIKDDTVVENNKIAIVMEKRRGEKKPEKKKMKFRFYCEICDVGAFCEKVNDSHMKGRKHLSRLDQLGAKR